MRKSHLWEEMPRFHSQFCSSTGNCISVGCTEFPPIISYCFKVLEVISSILEDIPSSIWLIIMKQRPQFLVFGGFCVFFCLFVCVKWRTVLMNWGKLQQTGRATEFSALFLCTQGTNLGICFFFLFHLNGQARETFSVVQREYLLLAFAN